MTKVFWCEPTGMERVWLRRYAAANDVCPATKYSFHNAMTFVADIPEDKDEDGYLKVISADEYKGDQRWPILCECGYAFTQSDHWQVFRKSIYKRMDDPSFVPIPWEDMPVGAMRDCWWMRGEHWTGADGISLVVKVPPDGHEWHVDSRCSNCTLPNDNVHKCWVRHGDPKKGEVHVDKAGNTCAAGAGSIDTGKWHGFLHNSILGPA